MNTHQKGSNICYSFFGVLHIPYVLMVVSTSKFVMEVDVEVTSAKSSSSNTTGTPRGTGALIVTCAGVITLNPACWSTPLI
nr:hypothetical protein [Priestia flexa]